MGVYSQFAVNGFAGEEITANESYSGTADLYRIMEETNINTHSIFNHIIECDFAEVYTKQGVLSESTLEAINEASLKGIFDKVISFFKKIGEKIKGILTNAMTKLNGMFAKDTKQLFKKYEKTVNKKLNNGTYDEKFTYKWCKSHDNKPIDSSIGGNGDVAKTVFNTTLPDSVENNGFKGFGIKSILQHANNAKADSDTNAKNYNSLDDDQKKARKAGVSNFNKEDNNNNKALTSDDLKEYKDKILSAFLSSKSSNGNASTDNDSFSKDMDEVFFDDEETKEGFTSSDMDYVRTCLCDNKSVSTLEREKRQVDKEIKDIIKDAEKIQKEMDKLSGKEEFSSISALARVKANGAIAMGNVCNTCVTMLYNSFFAAIKKDIKQCRAVFIKAATYNKKTAKNEAALLEEYVQVSNDEVDEMLADF